MIDARAQRPSAEVVPNPTAAAVLVRRTARDEGTEVLLERVATDTG